MKKIFLGLFMIVGLVGCVSTELSTKDMTYNAKEHARIRLYGQNGKVTDMKLHINGKPEEVSVGRGMRQAFLSLLRIKGNESIGMPDSVFRRNYKMYTRLLSQIFYKEFIIPPGKVTVQSVVTPDFSSDGRCESNTITFDAMAGVDYEVIPYHKGYDCLISLQTLDN